MGTRGAYGFRIDGKDKLTYNHLDSYPTGLGVAIAKGLKQLLSRNKRNLAEDVRAIRLVSRDDEPTEEDKHMLQQYANLSVSSGSTNNWYCLLREMQSNIEAHVECGIMIDSNEFVYDSLFCEWAYVVNIDTRVLEIYRGFNKDSTANGRYANRHRERLGDYFGIRLIEEIPFERIAEIDIEKEMGKIEEELHIQEED